MGRGRGSAVSVVLGSRFFRSAVIGLFFSGIGVSAVIPQLTLFLVDELGASLPVAGLYYLTNLAAPFAGYLVGRASDRQQDRLIMFRICAVVGAVGWLVIGLAQAIWVPFVVSVLALSVGGAAMGQLFAACRDELSRKPTPVDNQVIALVRMAFTAGWVLGPVLGSWFGSAVGLRPMVFATAACLVLQVIPLGRQRVPRFVRPVSAGDATAGPARLLPLLIFMALTVCAMAGDTIKFGYLPIYMDQQLHFSPFLRGAVIGIQPLLEFLLMPVAARLADRFGPLKVLPVGVAFGVLGNLAYATSDAAPGLFVGQLLVAVHWACLGVLGVTIAQELYPERVATASGLFMSAMPIAGAVGGVIGGLGVATYGLPRVFFLPAGIALIGCLGMIMLGRWQQRRGRPQV
ncbi:MFS transporter [Microlunatus speluncae]|uniref:MFS transporter n=1 Tax=Microlunatus speluncae TaxID=2594267 RepID=UPI0012663783|nr:MFS transporter [Microlunatus speluncae]